MGFLSVNISSSWHESCNEMSNMELKHDDLSDFSKMCAPEYNRPEFSDRILVLDVMQDEWETPSLEHISVAAEFDESPFDSFETCIGKRSLEASDEEPEQKRIRKIGANNESPVAVLNTTIGNSIEMWPPKNKQVDKPPLLPPPSFIPIGSVSEKSLVIPDFNETQGNLNGTLRQHKIYVHGVWLAVQSPYFRSLLHSSGMKEAHDTEVHLKIPESEENAHLVLLEAMYRNEVLNDKSVDEVLDVLELADKYDVKFVFKKCKYVLQQNATTFGISAQIMHVIKVKHDMSDVEDLAATLQLVLAQEFSPLDENWQSEKFNSLSEPSLKYLLSSDDLIVQSENTVFHALMHWMERSAVDPTALKKSNDLLAVVRFKLVTIDYLYNVINNHPIASKMPKFNELYLDGMTYHAIPTKQKTFLPQQPVLRKKPKRKISQKVFLITKEVYDAAKKSKTKLNLGEFWACGYQIRVYILRESSIGSASDFLILSVSNLNKQSLVPLKFMYYDQNGSIITRDQETFNSKLCEKQSSRVSFGSSCLLGVVIEPL